MAIPYESGESLTCQQLRELDVLAIEHLGIPGLVLMENAGRGAAEIIYNALLRPETDPVLILCGAGNNGGDGFVIARHLHNAGVGVTIALASDPVSMSGDPLTHYEIVSRCAIPVMRCDLGGTGPMVEAAFGAAAVIVDALLGTGARGAPRGTFSRLIERANTAAVRRIAIDIPSGLDADTGEVYAPCFRADMTITMVATKTGFSAEAARAVLGRVRVVEIGLPRRLIPGRKNLDGGT